MKATKMKATVRLEVNGKTLELSLAEVQQLRDLLDSMVKKEDKVVYIPSPYPVYPTYPSYPWYSTSTTITATNSQYIPYSYTDSDTLTLT